MDQRGSNSDEDAGWFRGEFALIALLVISLGALALIGLLAKGG